MTSNPVVHVIDDDDAARESLAFLLGTAQFVVRAYESAKAFLDAIPGVEAGCVITDVRMPEIDGLELLASSQESRDWPAGGRHHRPWRCSPCRGGDQSWVPWISSKSPTKARSCSERCDPRSVHTRRMQSETLKEPRFRKDWQISPPASGRSWMALSLASPTRSLPMTSASAPGRSKSTGPTS